MHPRFRPMHWLKLTGIWAAGLVLILLIPALIYGHLPASNLIFLAISFGSLLGTWQYRRDLTLSVRESLLPWVASAVWSAVFVFWSLSVKDPLPAIDSRLELAIGLGFSISLLCLFPLRWIIQGFGASRFAP